MTNLTAVLTQLEQQRARLTFELSQIENALSALSGRVEPKRRKLSKAAIARIRAAQKARWAQWRKSHKKS